MMATYSNMIEREDADELIPDETSQEIMSDLGDTSWLLNTGRRLPNLSTETRTIPVLDSLPMAGFVDSDTGLKRTTDVSWADKSLTAEEVAVVVPIPQAVLDDSDYDIWAEVRPLIVDAFNKVLNGAVLYGTNIPASWGTAINSSGLVGYATDASNVASLASFTDFYGAVEGESSDGAADGLLALLEADGFQATRHVAAVTAKSQMRNCRDANGQKIYPDTEEIDGVEVVYPNDGSIDDSNAYIIGGDWSKLVYSIRQDMTYTVSTEGVITNETGAVEINLFTQDSVALRAVMRIAFAAPNPINYMEETDANRSPWAILTS